MVDRYRPRRNTDLRDFASDAPEMANLDQPRFGNDDPVCGHVRGPVSDPTPRPPVAGVLFIPISEWARDLAAVPQPVGLGCVCGFHLLHGIAGFLVRRPDPGYRRAARSGEIEGCT